MNGLCKGVNGVRASGPNYPPFSGRSELAAPKVFFPTVPPLQFSKKTEQQQISVVARLQLSAGKLFSPWGLRQDKIIEFHRRTVV